MDIRVIITGRFMDVYTWPLMFLDRLIIRVQKRRRRFEAKTKIARRKTGNGPKVYLALLRAAEWMIIVTWAFCYYFLLVVLRTINFFRSLFSA